MRLIDADELKEKLKSESYWTYTHEYGDAIPVGWAMSAIDNAPTVELFCSYLSDGEVRQPCVEAPCKAERQQGEWIDEGQYAEGHSEHAYSCKNCGYHIIAQSSTILENLYCKHCGADMRKGVRKNE